MSHVIIRTASLAQRIRLASLVAHDLKTVVERRGNESTPVEIEHNDEARDFIEAALETVGEATPRHAGVSHSNYRLATHAISQIISPRPETREEIDAILHKYSVLVRRLATRAPLKTSEYDTVEELRRFFQEIAKESSGEMTYRGE